MLQRLPQQWDRSAMADDGDDHHGDPDPENGGIGRQMQGLAWRLRLLHRPEHQRAIKALRIKPPVGERVVAAALPAGRHAASQQNRTVPLFKTECLAQQRAGHHPAKQQQMTLAVTFRKGVTPWLPFRRPASTVASVPGRDHLSAD